MPVVNWGRVIYWTSTSRPGVPPCAASIDLSPLQDSFAAAEVEDLVWIRGGHFDENYSLTGGRQRGPCFDRYTVRGRHSGTKTRFYNS
jgi:hypothetical protein